MNMSGIIIAAGAFQLVSWFMTLMDKLEGGNRV